MPTGSVSPNPPKI